MLAARVANAAMPLKKLVFVMIAPMLRVDCVGDGGPLERPPRRRDGDETKAQDRATFATPVVGAETKVQNCTINVY